MPACELAAGAALLLPSRRERWPDEVGSDEGGAEKAVPFGQASIRHRSGPQLEPFRHRPHPTSLREATFSRRAGEGVANPPTPPTCQPTKTRRPRVTGTALLGRLARSFSRLDGRRWPDEVGSDEGGAGQAVPLGQAASAPVGPPTRGLPGNALIRPRCARPPSPAKREKGSRTDAQRETAKRAARRRTALPAHTTQNAYIAPGLPAARRLAICRCSRTIGVASFAAETIGAESPDVS
ncbi:hypothetical protein RHAL1_03472 [Beijerinckiaceae bacterium RH AL1]|nr:hypothetical protein RHCH11_RHCH11_03407 [Beijerinckiaceae bacterium RH CH11]VVB48820.1 hypothetical protein RHAL8_03403 [Beijerinckiaceae bacterium RH AL8]VVC56544.1 hypothetical protein RHAL1_03472 [Beijerinckiaceae bacterium RH AL1]